MKFRRLTIWTLVFIMSGLVCLLNPDEGYSEGSIYKRNFSRNFLKQFTRQNIKRQNRKLYSQKTKEHKTGSFRSNIKLRMIPHNVAIGEGGFQPRIAGVSGYLIWNNFGIGQTEMVYYYNNYDSENSLRFDLRNTTNDLSYTFGEDYNLTLGLGAISNGKGNIVTNSRKSIAGTTLMMLTYLLSHIAG